MSARRGALFLALALAAGSCAPHALAPPAAEPLSLLGSSPLIVPFGATVGGFRVGGLSGVVRAAAGTWLAVVDNEGEKPARVFRLAFMVSESGVAPLLGKTALEVPAAAIPLAGFDGKNFDGEGLALEPSGEMLISSEVEPSIREFSLEGQALRSLPVPELFLAGKGRGIRSNLGFESLTLAPGGDVLWTANERALQQDAPEDLMRPSPVRLLRYERRDGGFVPGAQFVYEVEPLRQRAGAGFQVRGLADLLALPGGDLLALEREFVEGRGFQIQIFRISLAGATDVSGMESLAGPLAGRSWTPVRKTLVYDFARSGFVPDNIEGMTFGPTLPDGSRTLVLVSDNNFNPLEKTQIVALRLRL
ncbi:MAG TPA: esterase-like activity of phytase family protein [Thermoanaerobaculia bacterium]|nr:esterase-like activity of phytase family protein [Thermoanaerobaculia bacterium]